jgi:hypothetical protein
VVAASLLGSILSNLLLVLGKWGRGGCRRGRSSLDNHPPTWYAPSHVWLP